MSKQVRIFLRGGHSIVLPLEQVEQILASEEQIITFYDEQNRWTGESINKSEIIRTERDYEEERFLKQESTNKLPEPKGKLLSKEEIRKFRPDFISASLKAKEKHEDVHTDRSDTEQEEQ